MAEDLKRTNEEVDENIEENKEKESGTDGYVERKRWLFLGLPFTFTKYTISDDVITIDTGFLNTRENDCYLYKVQDVELKVSFWERIAGLGTIICYTGDTTHPQLLITHIKHSKEVKNYILKMSEIARRKRRTLNTLNIDADAIDDGDF